MLLLLVALALRLPNLGEPADNYDEGVYLESLLLMARGYQPFAEIVTSQGPLHLYTQLPFFLLFGQTVAAGRAAAVLASLVVLVGVWWVARELCSRWAGCAAVALLLASPTYLRFSRQALADLPAVAPATLAVGAALAHRRTGRAGWVVAAGLLLALAGLMKPLALTASLAVVALVWRPRRSGWRNLALLAGSTAGPILFVLLALGLTTVLAQVLGFRDEARTAYGWSLERNWDLVVDKIDQEQPGLFLLALVGTGIAALRRTGAAAVTLWALAGLGLLLAHSPLRYHHMIILMPPLAILGGVAAVALPSALARPSSLARRILAVGSLVAVLVYLGGVPELARRDALLLQNIDAAGAGSDDMEDEMAAVERIQRLSTSDDFIVTDQPYLAFLAGRRVPPELVDPSEARLRSGDLTEAEVLTLAEAYHPKLIVLWTGKLSRLPGFMGWVRTRYETNRRFGSTDSDQSRIILRAREI